MRTGQAQGRFAWIVAGMLGLSLVAMASDLDAQREKYEKVLSDIVLEVGMQVADLNTQYKASLVKGQKAYASKGDLDAAIAIKNEQERFAADKSVSAENIVEVPAALARSQQSYIAKVQSINREKADRILSLVRQYDRALSALQASLTKKEDFDNAIKVREERERVIKSDEVIAAKKLLEPKAGSQAPVVEKEEPKKVVTATKVVGFPDLETNDRMIRPMQHRIIGWRLEEEHAGAKRYRISVKHAADGDRGAIVVSAWTDNADDGVPDTRLDRSNTLKGDKDTWSSWDLSVRQKIQDLWICVGLPRGTCVYVGFAHGREGPQAKGLANESAQTVADEHGRKGDWPFHARPGVGQALPLKIEVF